MNFTCIDKSNFNKVIKFLALGFKWKDDRILQVKDYLLNSNKNEEFYGFVIFEESEKILGAILTPVQFRFKNQKVISLMAWFINKEKRGILSLNFALYFINFLKTRNFIITDYTPSKAVMKILRHLKFSEMKVITRRNLLFLNPLRLIKSCFVKQKYKIDSISWKNANSFFKDANQGDMNLYSITFKNHKTFFIGKKIILRKKFCKYVFKIPVFRVFWIQSENFVLNSWHDFCFSIFKDLNFLLIYVDIRDKRNSKFKKNNYFFYDPNYFIFDQQNSHNFIPAIGSELALKFDE